VPDLLPTSSGTLLPDVTDCVTQSVTSNVASVTYCVSIVYLWCYL